MFCKHCDSRVLQEAKLKGSVRGPVTFYSKIVNGWHLYAVFCFRLFGEFCFGFRHQGLREYSTVN